MAKSATASRRTYSEKLWLIDQSITPKSHRAPVDGEAGDDGHDGRVVFKAQSVWSQILTVWSECEYQMIQWYSVVWEEPENVKMTGFVKQEAYQVAVQKPWTFVISLRIARKNVHRCSDLFKHMQT